MGMLDKRGGSRKKFKCTIKEVDDTIVEFTNNDATTIAPAEAIKEPVNNTTSADSSIDDYPFEKPLTNSPTVETITEVKIMPVKDHSISI